MEESFSKIYSKNIWGGGSGSGSKMTRNNKKYIEILQGILDKYKIKTICDIGCGDWEFSQFIDFGEREYLGIDCVLSVIEEDRERFKGDTIRFEHKTIGDDYIPEGYDLIIIKDVIQHWTDEDIMKYFSHIIEKNKYVFSTNGYKFMRDPTKNNLEKRDISNQYRYHPVSVEKYPLSEFKDYIKEKQTYHAKEMILFSK
tara:strand:- start:1790 stop:2386 length:597 start_codon:yes stop_codon:yes gene_type:complete